MGRDESDARRLEDFAGTVVFLLVQAALWRATLFLTPGPGVYVGLAVLALSLAVSVWRIARTRPAFGVAIIGCAVQLVLGGLAWLLDV